MANDSEMVMLKENLRDALHLAIAEQKKRDSVHNIGTIDYCSAFRAGMQTVVDAINNGVPIKIK